MSIQTSCAILPEWLEAFRLDDDPMARAYEQTPASCRAAIKTGIAYAFFHFGPQYANESHFIGNPALGFATKITLDPARKTMLLFAGALGAAQFAAAALLPILAGSSVTAIYMGYPPPAFLLAMELCGVEDLFAAPEDEIMQITNKLASQSDARDRIFIISDNTWPKQLPAGANNILISQICDSVHALDPAENPELIEFCCGQSREKHAPADKADIIYAGKEKIEKAETRFPNARLILPQGCEGVWLFPNLGPDNFRIKQIMPCWHNKG